MAVTRHDAEALADRLPALLVKADRVASTVAQGVHGRRRVGTGDSFWQFRSYVSGDSVSRIDWRQTAKSDRAYIRENEWEAAQTVWLWCDRSASMAWRSDRLLETKADRARLLTLALAALLLRGGERVALLAGGAPVAGRGGLDRFAAAMDSDRSGTGLPGPVHLPRHATVVLIGDLLEPLDEVRASVGGLAKEGVRGHLLQVLDPAEESLPFDGRVRFEGLEGDRAVLISRTENVRDAYQARLAAQRAGLAEIARRAGWSFAAHRTDHPPHTALLGLYGAMADLPRSGRC